MKALVIGAGTMGQGIAQVAAQAGYYTMLHDADAATRDRAIARIYDDWTAGIERSKVTPEQFGAWKDALHYCTEMEAAAADADIIIEAVPERLDLKKRIFAQLDEVAGPDAILASNTSGLPIRELAAATSRPGHVAGMHFFNPVPRMRLLEVVHHPGTDPGVLKRIHAIGAEMGKTTITVTDTPGFATSRLGVVLGNEAMRMLESGVASAADLDTGQRLGYGHPMGPLILADLVGLDVHMQVSHDLAQRLGGDHYAPPDVIQKLVAVGDLGQKTGRGFYDWSTTPPSPRPLEDMLAP